MDDLEGYPGRGYETNRSPAVPTQRGLSQPHSQARRRGGRLKRFPLAARSPKADFSVTPSGSYHYDTLLVRSLGRDNPGQRAAILPKVTSLFSALHLLIAARNSVTW